MFAWLRNLFRRRLPDPDPAPPDTMHWRPHPWLPGVVCRAEGYLRWTADLEHSTCVECRELGYVMVLQRRINTR